MKPVLDALEEHQSVVLLFLCFAALGLLVAIAVLGIRLTRLQKVWNALGQEAQGENLEQMLLRHVGDRQVIQKALDDHSGLIQQLEDRMASAKRFVGMIRYDAFEDVGGSQSFALAVYDEQGDGVVVTSVVGRTDCRVYCKAIIKGRAERALSQEEQRAIQDARDSGPKTVLSASR